MFISPEFQTSLSEVTPFFCLGEVCGCTSDLSSFMAPLTGTLVTVLCVCQVPFPSSQLIQMPPSVPYTWSWPGHSVLLSLPSIENIVIYLLIMFCLMTALAVVTDFSMFLPSVSPTDLSAPQDHGTSSFLFPRTEDGDLLMVSKCCSLKSVGRGFTLSLPVSDQLKSQGWWESVRSTLDRKRRHVSLDGNCWHHHY